MYLANRARFESRIHLEKSNSLDFQDVFGKSGMVVFSYAFNKLEALCFPEAFGKVDRFTCFFFQLRFENWTYMVS